MQEDLIKLLLAISEGKGDESVDLVIRVSEKDEDFKQVEFRSCVSRLLAENRNQGLQQLDVGTTLLEMKEFVGGLPARLNRIMDAITNQELEVKVKAVDAKLVMEGFEKIANRITTGIVLGALIMGACLLMRVESSFRLLGYPGLAIVCFLLAATGGFWLVITILVQNHRSRKKRPQ